MEPAHAELSWKNYAILVAYILNTAVTFGSLLEAFPGETNTVLSAKYQTLVTPVGYAFSIWGPIFIGEGIFVVCQMLPRFRSSPVVEAIMPGWLFACAAQVCWTLFFAQESVPASEVCMLGILAGLSWVAFSTDGLAMTWTEYGALRWGLSMHLGWIICASAVNTNVLADFQRSTPEALLGLAVTSVGAVCIIATIFALVKKSPDPIVCLVVAWAFNGINVELSDPVNLNSPDRHNPYTWSPTTLDGVKLAASNIKFMAIALAGVAGARVLWSELHGDSGNQKSSDHAQELVDSSAQAA